MGQMYRPYRSLLYIPGSKERALDKAQNLPTDGIIFDLEDAVAASEKDTARALVVHSLVNRDYGKRALMVRVNGYDTKWIMDDLNAICDVAPKAILLPKVDTAQDVLWLDRYLNLHRKTAETEIWAMMESPLGILNAREIAASTPRLKGLVLGTNDLEKDLMARPSLDRSPIMTSLGLCLLAARAHGLVCVDGVYNAFKDTENLRVMCTQGRDLGFDGKTLIHPSQIAIANEVFAPSAASIDLANRQIAAFDEAQSKGLGIAILDGNIVENLHVETAKVLLSRAAAIQTLESTA